MLNRYFCVSEPNEKPRLAEEFGNRVENAAKELQGVGKAVDEDGVTVIILKEVQVTTIRRCHFWGAVTTSIHQRDKPLQSIKLVP